MTLPSRPVSSAGGMTPRRVAAEDEVDLLTLDMHPKLDPFQVNSAKSKSGTDTPADLSRQSTPNHGANNSRRKSIRLRKRQSTAKDDSSSDKIEPLHHIDMDNIKKRKFCDKCKGLLLIKDATGKTISAVEVVDSENGERQQICKFCNDKEKAKAGRKVGEVGKMLDGNVCCLCQRVESLKWHHCLPGELRPVGGGVFCHRCWTKDYRAKRKVGGQVEEVAPAEEEETLTKRGKNVCSLCKSTDSKTWHSCFHGQPRMTDGTVFCQPCYAKDYIGKRRASGDTQGICCRCNSCESHKWHKQLHGQSNGDGGAVFCSKCYQKDFRDNRKPSGKTTQNESGGTNTPMGNICCVSQATETTRWYKYLYKDGPGVGLWYCNSCCHIDYREKVKIERWMSSEDAGKEASKKRVSPEMAFAEDPGSELNESSPAKDWTTSDDLALCHLLKQPDGPIADIANELRESKLNKGLGLPYNSLPSSPQKLSPARRARERHKMEEEHMDIWEKMGKKEKVAGWGIGGERWRRIWWRECGGAWEEGGM